MKCKECQREIGEGSTCQECLDYLASVAQEIEKDFEESVETDRRQICWRVRCGVHHAFKWDATGLPPDDLRCRCGAIAWQAYLDYKTLSLYTPVNYDG